MGLRKPSAASGRAACGHAAGHRSGPRPGSAAAGRARRWRTGRRPRRSGHTRKHRAAAEHRRVRRRRQRALVGCVNRPASQQRADRERGPRPVARSSPDASQPGPRLARCLPRPGNARRRRCRGHGAPVGSGNARAAARAVPASRTPRRIADRGELRQPAAAGRHRPRRRLRRPAYRRMGIRSRPRSPFRDGTRPAQARRRRPSAHHRRRRISPEAGTPPPHPPRRLERHGEHVGDLRRTTRRPATARPPAQRGHRHRGTRGPGWASSLPDVQRRHAASRRSSGYAEITYCRVVDLAHADRRFAIAGLLARRHRPDHSKPT
jgi:hypothetical protein